MAALVEGQQYGLSSQGNYSNNKTLIFVKLTDSALKAVEEYCRERNGCTQKPFIQFKANQGLISVPRPHSNSCQRFGFGVSTVEKDGPQGSFECIQKTGSRSLESLGCMLYKMHIRANEDSYENTRVKMAVVEQESKKNCTKEIKLSTPLMPGRKVKVKRSLSSIPARPHSSPSHSTPQVTRAPVKSQPVSTYNKFSNNHHHSFSNSNNNKSDVMKRSYREHVIHLLALKPYKKPELLVRLKRDDVKDRDKMGLSVILNQVAVLKDNAYVLARHAWMEVQDDWPFYSPEDREQVKKNKPQNLTPPPAVVENGHHSPSASPVNQQKRVPDYEAPACKRQRISHFNRPEPSNGTFGKLDSSRVQIEEKSPPPDSISPKHLTESHNTNTIPVSSEVYPDSQSSKVNNQARVTSTTNGSWLSPNSSPDSGGSSGNPGNDFLALSPIDPANDVPDYVKKYVEISTPEQRAQFKADFNAEYEEYKILHSTIELVSRRFADLENSLKNALEGSKEWKRVKSQIVLEYEMNKKNEKYQEARRKLQYLHEKLAHIKKLVVDYDSRVTAVKS